METEHVRRRDVLHIVETTRCKTVEELKREIVKAIKALPNENAKRKFTPLEVMELMIDYGFHKGGFGWGETTRLTPSEVGNLLTEKAKGEKT